MTPLKELKRKASGLGRDMMKQAGYEIRDCLYKGSRSKVYRALRQQDQTEVILKVHAHEFPRQAEVARFRREYEIGQHFQHEHIVRYLGLEQHHHGLALVIEDFGGVSLLEVIPEAGFELATFLDIALAIVNGLHQVHQQGIIHKDIKPANILFHPDLQQVKLSDFGISTHLEEPVVLEQHGEFLEGTVAYISPEQTGRMNRKVDYRSDFYSLGVTFYEMLCGHLPFNALDTSEMIHCHIARMPEPLYLVKPDIPRVISDLVQRLMAKCAEDRYQSSLGLKADLERCRDQLGSGFAEGFILGERDLSQRFELSQKLYGRQHELDALKGVIERIEAGGREAVLVCGPMGSGKSMLLGEIQKTVLDKRGYFITGKFHHENQDQPFGAVIAAMRDLLRQILVENDARVTSWRHTLLSAIGEAVGTLLEALPELGQVIGNMALPIPPPSQESELRFNHALRQLVHVSACRQLPIAFLLEDLHLADEASLRLMTQLLEDSDVSHFVFLGTFAGRDIPEDHPLVRNLSELAPLGVPVTRLQLAPLNHTEIAELIAETLHASDHRVVLLADVVARKTKGNPYFVCEFLKTLSHKGLLRFDSGRSEWTWDLRAINDLEMTPNVVNLLAAQISAMPGATVRMLSMAAALGLQFDLKTLADLTARSPDDLVNDLWPALENGLLISLGPIEIGHADQSLSFKFSHDRLQQVVYERLDEQQLPHIHLTIGRLLLAQPGGSERRLFEIISHLNRGRPLIEDMGELIYLIKADLMAAKKALAAGSYEVAAKNLSMAMKFLPADAWETTYETVFELYATNAHCAWLVADNREAERCYNTLIERARPGLDAVRAHVFKVDFYQQCNRPDKAVAFGSVALTRLGQGLTEVAKPLAYLETRWLVGKMRRMDPARLLELPPLHDPYRVALLDLLRSTCNAYYQTGALRLFAFATARLLKLTLQWGNCPASAYAYVCYGILLRRRGKPNLQALRFGRLGLELIKRYPKSEATSRLYFLFGTFVDHWYLPLRSCESVLEEGRRIGLERGDTIYSVWNVICKCIIGLTAGKFLRNLDEELMQLERYLHQNGARFEFPMFTLLRQLVRYHMGLTANPQTLDEDAFRVGGLLEKMQRRKQFTAVAFFHFARMQIHFNLGDFPQALSAADDYARYAQGLAATPVAVEGEVLTCLIRFALMRQQGRATRRAWLKSIRATIACLARQGRTCPENFRHKELLLRAELAYHLGKDAADLYDMALEDAYDNGFPHMVALISELAGRYWLARGRRKIARSYLTEAIAGFQSWGAERKVTALRKEFQPFLSVSEQRRPVELSTTDDTGSSPENQLLDIRAITKAVLALSSEIDFRKLVGTMLSIMIENAGAERGFLILTSSGTPLIHAYGEGGEIELLPGHTIQERSSLAASVVRFVIRSGESVVLGDATGESMFSKDPYLVQRKPRSLLCIPIRQKDRIAGALYLENNLTTEVFNEERVKTLGILLAQAAFCLEHSRLYTETLALNKALKREIDERKGAEEAVRQLNVDLERRVRERTDQLERSQQELLERAHAAGMADIATSVLHNVGNILSSITTSSQLIRSSVEAPTLAALGRANGLLSEHLDDLPGFMAPSEKGPKLMQFYLELEKLFQRDYGKIHENLGSLMTKVDSIRDVIMAQQSFAAAGFRTEPMLLSKVVDDAISILDNSLNRHEIQLIKIYAPVPPVTVQKAKLTHAIINILKNAKEAMLKVAAGEKRITIETDWDGDWAFLRISDVGCGIAEEHLGKVFTHGFTTKKNGHGFGLHSCANAMTEMGGCLRAESAGPGRGATFILQFPMTVEQELAGAGHYSTSS